MNSAEYEQGFQDCKNADNELIAKLRADVKRISAERDAAIADIAPRCEICSQYDLCAKDNSFMFGECGNWKWRGLPDTTTETA